MRNLKISYEHEGETVLVEKPCVYRVWSTETTCPVYDQFFINKEEAIQCMERMFETYCQLPVVKAIITGTLDKLYDRLVYKDPYRFSDIKCIKMPLS